MASGGGRVAGKMLVTMGGSVVVILAMVVGGIWKTGRKAIVSACPIAYVGTDRRLHLTNVTGTLDVELAGPAVDEGSGGSTPPPAWSPFGTKILYHPYVTTRPAQKEIVVQEPMSGRQWTLKLIKEGWIAGWASDENVLECHVGFRDVRTGALLQEVPREGFHVRQISPLPRGVGGGFVAIGPERDGDSVHLRDRGFDNPRTIFNSRGNCVPRVDPRGEWVGWTNEQFHRAGYPDGYLGKVIQIKRLNEAPESLPRVLGEQFAHAVFCDWTEDGDILANVQEKSASPRPPWPGDWCLVILDKDGRLLRKIPTDVRPRAQSGASWRKWGNR
ncbi:MAG: hypothetical protein NTU53_03175 [Planctomycetota bacterium]|nr:hypothetical protein [Planctomycetota bacterium]